MSSLSGDLLETPPRSSRDAARAEAGSPARADDDSARQFQFISMAP